MNTGKPQAAPIDRYVVLEYLAEGGMGAIYLGKKLGAGGFEKQVVLKQLLPEFTKQPEFIDLFLREARLSATLDHANIIHTIDLVTAGDEYFIVMEYLDGADLRTLLKRTKKRRKKMSAGAAIYVARELLSALAYAHSKTGPDGRPLNLIHRDVSPSNILISGSGEVKLTDFGIAKASTHNSVFYRVKGKVGYMSPEQARSETLDARSDLYSLAVCIYEVITGERLFVGVGLSTSADEMYSQPIPLVSRKVRGLPPALDKVMLRALSVDPDHRYQTAGEFQESLLRVAHRHGLMMSAPEVADHLADCCGDPIYWRDPNADVEPQVDAEGTEQINLEEAEAELEESDLLRVGQRSNSEPILAEGARRRAHAQTSVTQLSRLQGLELTSMIKISQLEDAGAKPLVDVGAAQPGRRQPSPRPQSAPKPVAPARTPTGQQAPNPLGVITTQRVPKLGQRPKQRGPSRLRGVLFGFAILVLGAGTTAAIGLTGPTLVIPGAGGSPASAPAKKPGAAPAKKAGAAPAKKAGAAAQPKKAAANKQVPAKATGKP